MLHKLRIQWNYWRARWWWRYRNTIQRRQMLVPAISHERGRLDKCLPIPSKRSVSFWTAIKRHR